MNISELYLWKWSHEWWKNIENNKCCNIEQFRNNLRLLFDFIVFYSYIITTNSSNKYIRFENILVIVCHLNLSYLVICLIIQTKNIYRYRHVKSAHSAYYEISFETHNLFQRDYSIPSDTQNTNIEFENH